jgi:hypothetical protein
MVETTWWLPLHVSYTSFRMDVFGSVFAIATLLIKQIGFEERAGSVAIVLWMQSDELLAVGCW